MTVVALIHALASAPLFASRAFLTAFMSALLFRFGPTVPWLQDTELIASLAAAPPWFTHDWALVAFGALALLEAVAERNPELRAAMSEFEGVVKGGVALGITFGLLDAQSAAVAAPVLGVSAGTTTALVGSAAAGAASWGLASVRRSLLRPLEDMDTDDILGVRSVIALAEEGGVFGGLALLVVAPFAAAAAIFLAVGVVAAAKGFFGAREEAAKVPCRSCSAPHHASAMVCPSCEVAATGPRAVGAFGQARQTPAPAPDVHAHALLMRRRCPRCATRLAGRALGSRCPTCETPAFRSSEDVTIYIEGLRGRMGITLGALACLSFLPVVGVVPGLILVRLAIISPLRAYTPAMRGAAARWGNRVATVLLLCLQPIPLLGAAMLPLIGWTSWAFHRAALEKTTS
jgi:Zn finger protein HypA/HybF involved in hydrogenase expression